MKLRLPLADAGSIPASSTISTPLYPVRLVSRNGPFLTRRETSVNDGTDKASTAALKK